MQDRRWGRRGFGRWLGRGSHRAHSGSEGGRKELEKKNKEMRSEGNIQRDWESLREGKKDGEGGERGKVGSHFPPSHPYSPQNSAVLHVSTTTP